MHVQIAWALFKIQWVLRKCKCTSFHFTTIDRTLLCLVTCICSNEKNIVINKSKDRPYGHTSFRIGKVLTQVSNTNVHSFGYAIYTWRKTRLMCTFFQWKFMLIFFIWSLHQMISLRNWAWIIITSLSTLVQISNIWKKKTKLSMNLCSINGYIYILHTHASDNISTLFM
jgi:hypothetical protein